MNIICAICKDHLVQSDEIFHTQCAHVFHFQCLTQWLERSSSCPQCRDEVTQSKIYRLYFTFSNNEPAEPQTCSTKERIDTLKFKILLKEKDIQYYTSKTITLEKQNAGLKQEVRKVESEISKQNSIIYELREEMKYCDELKKEIAHLKSKIEDLEPIETLLRGPLCNVNKMIENTKDPEVLTKYISVMKKELIASFEKRKDLRTIVKRLRRELAKVNTKYSSMSVKEQSNQMELEEKLAFAESKCMSLQKRVDELEEVLGLNEKCSNVSEHRNPVVSNKSDEHSPVEKMSKEEKINQETLRKTLTPTKRKMEQIPICSTKNTKDNVSNFESSNDSIESSLLNYSSTSSSLSMPKKSRSSSDNMNTSSRNDNTKLRTYSIPKKRRENITRKTTSFIENKQNKNIIDLT
ncbi:E3 ubiquitin-protein ligase TRAIP-like [Hylaeus volcanicus]|uniref:E3 ubiquitin-protein ligase TRAIP-like n=1 Tax=Hylaeus volcanicus TaxID=313075 RepID=UPI0023B7AD9F|nr:E3 ubiquitin-protein ligase TRAIP-like [Hylaeus volcanicus]